MANINKIRLSGQTYDIQDPNASKTVELTQAQYDALAVKDPNTFYVITDAQGADLSNYYTKSETSGATQISTALASKADAATTYSKTEVDTALNAKADTATTYTKTEVDTALASKQTTLTAGTNITIVDNVISATGGGGGKTVSGGTNISITTGETADTINCTLPISASTNGYGIILGASSTASAQAIASGYKTNAAQTSIAFGYSASTNSTDSIAVGQYNKIEGNGSTSRFALGDNNIISTYGKGALGSRLISNAMNEVSCGRYNISRGNNFNFGNSSDTLFTVGNGDLSTRHNALEIRQNGDIYVPNTDDTSVTGDYAYSLYPMVRLQDTITATAANTTALGGLSIVKLTESEYTALVTKDSNTLYCVVPDPSN